MAATDSQQILAMSKIQPEILQIPTTQTRQYEVMSWFR
jgi:hypothetical protein